MIQACFILTTVMQTESKASVTTGLKLNIPDNAVYYHSFDDSSQDQMAHWTPTLTPIKPKFKISSSASANLAGELRLVFEGSALGLDAELGFSLAAPSYNILAATSTECGSKKNKAGISLDIGVGVVISAFEVAKAEFLGKESKADAEQKIYSTTTPVYSTCLATPTAKRIV